MMGAMAAAAAVCLVDDATAAAAFRRYLLREPKTLPHDASADRYEAIYTACLAD